MLIKPPISDDSIIACLRDSFGLHIAHVTFLPIGDANSALYREQIFGMQGSVEDRQKGLWLMEQFLPSNVVEIAHRSYQQLS